MKFIKKVIILILILFSLFIINSNKVNAVDYTHDYYTEVEPVQEFRAVWMSNFIYDVQEFTNPEAYKDELCGYLDLLESMNINVILYHVRTHNNALYKSSINPCAKWFKNVDFEVFDPLEWLIEECHSRGIELHGWMNPYRVDALAENKRILDVVGSYEDYPMNPASSIENYLYNTETAILNPGLPNVREHILNSISEFINKYDVDGIHFDDYFYIADIDDSYAYNLYKLKNETLDDFERRQVDILIEDIHDLLTDFNKKNNKAICFGISPSGAYNGVNAKEDEPVYDEFGTLISPEGEYSNVSRGGHKTNALKSDTKKWVDNEWIDYLMPERYGYMDYNNYTAVDFTNWWSWETRYKKTNLYFGIGSSSANSKKNGWENGYQLADMINLYRSYEEVTGTCYFSFKALLNDNELINQFIETNNNIYQTHIPAAEIKNLDYVPSIKVNNLVYYDGILSWDKIDNQRGYLVYKVPKNEIFDYKLAKYLVSYQNENYINIEIDPNYKYYVSSVNFANKISDPVSFEDYYDANIIINHIDELSKFTDINDEFIYYMDLLDYELKYVEDYSEITNYIIYKRQNERLDSYYTMIDDLNEFIYNSDFHLYDNFTLDYTYKDYEFSYELVDKDSDKIDLVNNKITMEIFGPYSVGCLITIKNKYNDNYTKKINLTIGRLSDDGHYLFYRNASGSTIVTDPQEYTGSQLGFSNYVLCYDTYYLFLPKGNVLNITSNTLPKYSYPSCGVTYINDSLNTITIDVNDITIQFQEHGALVFNNGVIKIASDSLYDLETITLEPGDILFIPKNLDANIYNNPIKHFNDITKKCYLLTYEEFLEILKVDEKLEEMLRNNDFDKIKLTVNSIETFDERTKDCLKNVNKLISIYNNYLELENKKSQVINEINNRSYELFIMVNDELILINNENYEYLISEYNIKDSIDYINNELSNLKKEYVDYVYSAIGIDKCDNILEDFIEKFDNKVKEINVINVIIEPTETIEPTEPIETVDPTEPIETRESTKTSEPKEKTEPVEPTKPIDPVDNDKSSDDTKKIDNKNGCKSFLSLFNVISLALILLLRKRKY